MGRGISQGGIKVSIKARTKVFFVIAILLFISVSVSVSAQEPDKPNIFVKSVPIVKIYPHRLGYRVVYEKNTLDLHHIHVPLEWFREAGGKAHIVWGQDPAYPYLSVFWKDGEFSHIRLYLDEARDPRIWGDLKPGQLDDQFKDKETLNLQF